MTPYLSSLLFAVELSLRNLADLLKSARETGGSTPQS
jgi:hypothetical protein